MRREHFTSSGREKQRHKHLHAAHIHAKRLRRERELTYEVYSCRYCGYYHVGRGTGPMTRRERNRLKSIEDAMVGRLIAALKLCLNRV